jgi:formate--tetrahydrofolate ligase
MSFSGLEPHVSVLTDRPRSEDARGGPPAAPVCRCRKSTGGEFALVEKGLPNLIHHIGIIRKSGLNPVVCVNRFVQTRKTS